MASSPFGTFNGVEPFAIFPTVGLHAVAGDQVFLGRATYEPGTTVKRHSHEHTEQAMLIVDGSLDVTIGDETRTLGPGDTCVVNRGVDEALGEADDVVLVGHSLGASAIPLAAARRPVRHLVFLCALLPLPEQSATDRYRDEDVFVPGFAGHTVTRDDGASIWNDPAAAA